MSVRKQMSTAEALGVLEGCFGVDPGSLSVDATRDSIPGWDSMGALMLMAELDERFGLALSAESSRAMRQVSDVLAYLKAHDLLLADA